MPTAYTSAQRSKIPLAFSLAHSLQTLAGMRRCSTTAKKSTSTSKNKITISEPTTDIEHLNCNTPRDWASASGVDPAVTCKRSWSSPSGYDWCLLAAVAVRSCCVDEDRWLQVHLAVKASFQSDRWTCGVT